MKKKNIKEITIKQIRHIITWMIVAIIGLLIIVNGMDFPIIMFIGLLLSLISVFKIISYKE